MENTITISQERYDELIKEETRMQFIADYVRREMAFTTDDILYYLGAKNEEKSDEIS